MMRKMTREQWVAQITIATPHHARHGLPGGKHRLRRAMSQALASLALTVTIVLLPTASESLPVDAKPSLANTPATSVSENKNQAYGSVRTAGLQQQPPPDQRDNVAKPTTQPTPRYPRRSRQSLAIPFFSFAPW